MATKFNLSIPVPCHEKWETFQSAPGGGYCGSCSKVVTDFTKLSDDEIISFFKEKPKNSCGRFRKEQLTLYHFQDKLKRPSRYQLLKAGFVSLLMLVFNERASSQSPGKANTEQRHEGSVTKNISPLSFQFTGTVVAADDQSALPGVSVYVKGTMHGTITDVDGKFMIDVKSGDTITCSFIGFETLNYIVDGANDRVLKLQMTEQLLGEIIVGAVQTTNTLSFRRWWWRLRGLF